MTLERAAAVWAAARWAQLGPDPPIHFGWRSGEEWDALYDYFDKAWTGVLGNFRKRYDR